MTALHNEAESAGILAGDELSGRIHLLTEQANARPHSMREKADRNFTGRQERLAQFAETKVKATEIISKRLGILVGECPFDDAHVTCGDGTGCGLEAKCNGSTITVAFPASAKRVKRMDISFAVFHDADVKNAVIEYRLQLLPIFVKFTAMIKRPLRSMPHVLQTWPLGLIRKLLVLSRRTLRSSSILNTRNRTWFWIR